jgi:molybdopterin-guanine dinucleotide biosynthesis protein A
VPRDHEGRLQTVSALYARDALGEVERAIDEGRLALRDLVPRIGGDVLAFESFADLPDRDRLFFAINDPESWEEARRVASSPSRPAT